MPRVADHVHDHCLAVARDREAARAATANALERAPRALAPALGHARRFALLAAPDGDAVDLDATPATLVDLAWLLAGTRPPAERSLADLAVRHGLDRAGLGRAVDEPPAAAAARADALLESWEGGLRPVLLASLGPGECDGLGAVLVEADLADPAPEDDAAPPPPDRDPPTVGALLAAGPAVAAHAAACEVCGDRLRAMASVRSLLAQVPIVPAPAATPGRRRALPAPPATGRRRRLPLTAALAVLVAAIAVAVIVAAALADGDEDDVAVLTKVPARNALAASPAEARPGERVVIRNTGDAPVRWSTTSPPPWLRTAPASGRLAAGDEVEVTVVVGRDAPEGDVRADVTVAGRDGSTTLVRVRGSVERPPTIAAAAAGCTVTARVEDESEVGDVRLWWRAPAGDVSRSMTVVRGDYVAVVPPDAGATDWWVTATDGRGNAARTAAQPIDATGCA